jgi:microcompartment protein CcmK/EutM
MKLGTVIGRVVLSRGVSALKSARFLVVSPLSRAQYQNGLEAKAGMGIDPSVVVYDDLGGGVGDVIAYEEGREAAQPLDQPTPIDAINCALVDRIFYSPWNGGAE